MKVLLALTTSSLATSPFLSDMPGKACTNIKSTSACLAKSLLPKAGVALGPVPLPGILWFAFGGKCGHCPFNPRRDQSKEAGRRN
jgi:hypothetical protein